MHIVALKNVVEAEFWTTGEDARLVMTTVRFFDRQNVLTRFIQKRNERETEWLSIVNLGICGKVKNRGLRFVRGKLFSTLVRRADSRRIHFTYKRLRQEYRVGGAVALRDPDGSYRVLKASEIYEVMQIAWHAEHVVIIIRPPKWLRHENTSVVVRVDPWK